MRSSCWLPWIRFIFHSIALKKKNLRDFSISVQFHTHWKCLPLIISFPFVRLLFYAALLPPPSSTSPEFYSEQMENFLLHFSGAPRTFNMNAIVTILFSLLSFLLLFLLSVNFFFLCGNLVFNENKVAECGPNWQCVCVRNILWNV